MLKIMSDYGLLRRSHLGQAVLLSPKAVSSASYLSVYFPKAVLSWLSCQNIISGSLIRSLAVGFCPTYAIKTIGSGLAVRVRPKGYMIWGLPAAYISKTD